jgi:uncharacterized protein YyaL (SSP411 family)
MLTALEELLHPAQLVLIRGAADTAHNWAREISRLYAPRRIVLVLGPQAVELPAPLDKPARQGGTVAYVCRASTCTAPLDSLGALISELRAPQA